ncbi:hypothetical protein SOASR014_11820 [Pectobacterium carotovorum subsp. carotovorum]|nr:hypothetical protein SOASR014_11820 [Pectobacterium carotovorum subsp. carotovorum]GLX44358.1 hypothetical protein Pcaca01_20260 [Pectobacterium carotovorum subsp. carotovorum]
MSKKPGNVLPAGDDLLNIIDHTARSERVGRTFFCATRGYLSASTTRSAQPNVGSQFTGKFTE